MSWSRISKSISFAIDMTMLSVLSSVSSGTPEMRKQFLRLYCSAWSACASRRTTLAVREAFVSWRSLLEFSREVMRS